MDIYSDLIRTINDFPIKGIKFRDITQLLSNGDAYSQIIFDLNKELPSFDKFDKIICAESRGFIFGAPLAAYNRKGLVLARKPGKLPLVAASQEYDLEYGKASVEVSSGTINPGDKVVIMDDLIATGGSAQAMVELVKKCGGVPVLCLFLIELRSLEGYKKLGIPYKAIVSYGIHDGDILQINSSLSPNAFVTFKEKISDSVVKCVASDNTEIEVSKESIISIVEEDKEGKLRYIKYRD